MRCIGESAALLGSVSVRALLIGGTGRTDLPTGDPEELHHSLFERVLIRRSRSLELRVNKELPDPTRRWMGDESLARVGVSGGN